MFSNSHATQLTLITDSFFVQSSWQSSSLGRMEAIFVSDIGYLKKTWIGLVSVLLETKLKLENLIAGLFG